MSVIRVGSTSKYADGWDAVFGRSRPAKPGKKVASAKRAGKAKKTAAGPTKKAVTKARKPGKKRRG